MSDAVFASVARDANSWNDGYVVDVPYHEPIVGDLCPAALSMSAVLHGQPPIDRSRPLSWLDLGCGSGVNACMVAAANANVEVWGCDVNPAHVERARSLAAKAELDGCHFDEASFAEVAADERLGPGEADVIVMSGVYSWVSGENQRHLAEIVRRRLRPGGLVYVSYGPATGWSAMTPVAEAMHLHAREHAGPSDLAFPEAVTALTRLAEEGARAFPLAPREAAAFAALGGVGARPGAHEYLGAHFRPLVFQDVADAMAEARCAYVGSVDATDHLANLWAPPALQELVGSTTDLTVQQMLRDLIVQRPLRRDLFRRGVAPSNPVERAGWLQGLAVVGTGRPLPDEATVGVPLGTVTLDPGFYAPLVETLREQPLDLAGIAAVHPGIGLDDGVAALALLMAGGYAHPQARGWEDAGTRYRARRLNRVLIAENRRGGDHDWLAAPATGGAVSSDYVEMLTVGAVIDGAPQDVDRLVNHVLAELAHQRRLVGEDGALIDDETQARVIVQRRVSHALERLSGSFAAWGIS